MKIVTYEIGVSALKISTTFISKAKSYFEENEKTPFQHGLSIDDENFIEASIKEIFGIHQTLNHQGKVVIILPFFQTTTRSMTLPVGSKNKVKMMIPFQLDETLPVNSQKIHWIEHIHKRDKDSTQICLSIISKDLMERVNSILKDLEFYPSLLTTNFSVYLSYLEAIKKEKKTSNHFSDGNFVIMDMGQSQTIAYFFSQGNLIFNHYSNVGSLTIDENIADNYELDIEEAQLFKEENGFLFTKSDYELADPDQKIFARLMEKTLEPLILDFEKWDLAYRSKNSTMLDMCYITGGMAKMENMENFLSEQLTIETKCLSVSGFEDSLEYSEFLSHQMVSSTFEKGEPIGNFLAGKFKLNSGSSDILEGTAFYLSRSLILSSLLLTFLSLERIFIQFEKDKTNRVYKKIVSSKTLGLSKRDQISYRKSTKKLSKLIRPRLEIIKENKAALSGDYQISYNTLFEKMSKVKSINGIDLNLLSMNDKEVTARIKIKDSKKYDQALKALKTTFGNNIKDLNNSSFEIKSGTKND